MAKQFDSRIQNIVYQLEVGVGASVLKAFLYVLFMVLLALLFVATQYVGFNEPRAMDQAQLGRNFARTTRLNTSVVRPAATRHLIEKGKPAAPAGQPDVVNAPLYPLVLGSAFKIFGTDFDPPTRERYAPEQWIIIPINLALCFLTALFLYPMGLRMFSPRVALTAVTVFFLTGQVWAGAVDGTEISLALFLTTFSAWTLLKALDAREGPMWRALLPVAVSAAALCLLVLTRYAAAALIPGFLLTLGLGLRRRAWLPALLTLLILGAGLSPWILRNLKVSGAPFGLAPRLALRETRHDLYSRGFTPLEIEDTSLVRQTAVRALGAADKAFSFTEIELGSGIVLGLFIAAFFYSFQRSDVRHLRWGLLLSYLCLILAAGIFGSDQMELAKVFLPLVLLYGCAFFYLLLDRMKIGVNIVSLSVVALFILLQAVPMVATLLPPKPSSYPPYYARDIGLASGFFEPGELLCTDMPWATAWYGDQLSLYLPANVDDFFLFHDTVQPVSGLYLTPLTRSLPYHSMLVRGPYASWRPIMEFNLPGGFPLTSGFPLRNGEQVLLMDRNRLQERAP